MNRRMQILTTVFIILIIGLSVSGCSKEINSKPIHDVSKKELIKIGVIIPLTGDFALFGQAAQDALEFALDELKYNNIKIIYEDDKSCQIKEGLTALNKLIYIDKIDILISLCSDLVNAQYEITEREQIPYIELFEGLIYEDDLLFQMLPFSFDANYELGKYAGENYKKIAIINAQTNLLEKNAEYFIKGVEDSGGEIVYHAKIIPDERDFRTHFIKAEEKDADIIANFFFTENKIPFLRQYFDLGFDKKIPILGEVNYEIELPNIKEAIDIKKLERLNLTLVAFDFSGEKAFIEKFNNTYKYSPNIAAFLMYDAANLVLPILEKNKDPEYVKEKITNTKGYKGVLGEYNFDNNGVPHMTLYLKNLRNGQFEIVEEI